MATLGRSLELYFVDGHPDGMLTAEVFNWTGHVLRIPRTQLAEGLSRPQAKQTGVYLLLGQDDTGTKGYIGETENMSQRIAQHAREKDWWDIAVLITASGDALHKAHVKYLEARLLEAASAAKNGAVENGNTPLGASLNEAATANMESFLETLHMILPAIKVDFFQTRTRPSINVSVRSQTSNAAPRFVLQLPKHGIEASAILVDQELVVQAGSDVRANWVGDRKHKTHYWKIHDELCESGIISQLDQTRGTFTQNFAFSSPSAAAAIICGRSSNGREAWKTEDGLTYAQWESKKLEETQP
ncbi:GIY-YIG nuclease family protein [Tritonibacter mobilis]|uniref:GIY-YIG nuclease family protein n=1 Tax=Tritonibacter mobilis TaxID=379347 RepID=UPI001CDA0BC5|nr:GIY-YIG nuclease family protein [Tritonibacter mobilis]MCA2007217.1 GIY-YIG nuclease family protein [Tritonibacter mobilis]